jgi:hypothetical protein
MKIVYITSELRILVNNFLVSNNPKVEHGGFFYGRDNTLILPRFLPNTSNDQRSSYSPPNNWKWLTDIDKKLFNTDLCIHFHTHPDHTVISGQDIKVAMGKAYGNPLILLQYDEDEKKYSWKGYSNLEEWKVVEINKTFDEFKEYYSKSLGLVNLGNVYLTETNEILSDDVKAKIFLTLNEDVLTLYRHLNTKKHNSWSWNKPTYSGLSNDCGYSVQRVKKALSILNKNGLFKDLMK